MADSARTSTLHVVPLTSATWDMLTALFGEGGDPKWCWCTYFRLRGRAFGPAEANRDRLHELVDRDPAPGLVAVEDGRALGWTSLGPRTDFQRLEHSRVLPRLDDRPVWAIVCFVVSRRARGRGIAAALLTAAIAYAREHGAPALEAYPADVGEGRIAAAAAYTGTRRMFERAGFAFVRATELVTGGVPRVMMRLELELPGGAAPRASSSGAPGHRPRTRQTSPVGGQRP